MTIQSAEAEKGAGNKGVGALDYAPAEPQAGPRGGDVFAPAFGMTVAAWIVAYVSRMPVFPAPAPGQMTVLLMLSMVFVGGFLAARYSRLGALAALLAGILSGVLDILVIGSVLHDVSKSDAVAPAAALWMGGSVLLNGVVAGAGGLLGKKFPSARRAEIRWPAVFAVILTAATLPLITAGGLVTAYGVGMAVPDWPQSYGYNMFLFPLSKMQAAHGNFYEHAHRLMGSLVGLTSLAVLLYFFLKEQPFLSRGWKPFGLSGLLARVAMRAVGVVLAPIFLFIGIPIICLKSGRRNSLAAWCIFVAVCIQGILGGLRVTEKSIPLATAHGIFAQIVFAAMACMAAANSRSFVQARVKAPGSTDRIFSTALLMLMLGQLALGALVRQRVDSMVLLHITLAAAVALLAVACGFRALALHGGVAALRRTGIAVMGVVGMQLVLGIIALALRPSSGEAHQTTLSALWTTAHQANGALLLAMSAVLWLWNWRVFSADGPRGLNGAAA